VFLTRFLDPSGARRTTPVATTPEVGVA
jgi:hypothetical protein